MKILHIAMRQVPKGEVWVEIHGLYHDDLFRVPESNLDNEIAEARERYRQKYPRQNAVISITRMVSLDPGAYNE